MTRESFVIHSEYIEDLPEENKAEFLLYIYNFAIKGIEPELDSFAKTVWLKIKRRIEYDIEQWENTKIQRSESGKIGGLRSGEARRSKTKQNEAPLQTVKQTEANEAVSVYVSDNVNVSDNESVHTQSVREEEPQNIGTLQQDAFSLVTEHNSTAEKSKKVPVSGNFFSFCCKEMRELIGTIGTSEPPDRIKAALINFLKVAKSDTWRKTFTWRSFCQHYQEFTPDFFDIKRYLTEWNDTGDVSKRPDNVFFFAHKDDPRFKWRVFRDHKDEWEAEGRPDGEDYYRLQAKWEEVNNDADGKAD